MPKRRQSNPRGGRHRRRHKVVSHLGTRAEWREQLERGGRRPASARCPRCKKVRKLWLRANAYFKGRSIKSKNVRGEGKVCWICRIREVQPDWRPGMPRPDVLTENEKD